MFSSLHVLLKRAECCPKDISVCDKRTSHDLGKPLTFCVNGTAEDCRQLTPVADATPARRHVSARRKSSLTHHLFPCKHRRLALRFSAKAFRPFSPILTPMYITSITAQEFPESLSRTIGENINWNLRRECSKFFRAETTVHRLRWTWNILSSGRTCVSRIHLRHRVLHSVRLLSNELINGPSRQHRYERCSSGCEAVQGLSAWASLQLVVDENGQDFMQLDCWGNLAGSWVLSPWNASRARGEQLRQRTSDFCKVLFFFQVRYPSREGHSFFCNNVSPVKMDVSLFP